MSHPTTTDSDVIGRFSQGLEGLSTNDKNQINKLTYIAQDHKNNDIVAKAIAKLACKKVLQVPPALKLVSLYVIDSILKNVGDPYKILFKEKIVECFVQSFQNVRDEKGRLKLYNLRLTWKEIFSNRVMYDLDTKVHVLDPNWPIVAKPNDSKPSQNSDKKENDKPMQISYEGTPPKPTRDPRLKKKLTDDLPCDIDELSPKKPKTSHSNSPNILSEQFLIDRAGDDKMEKVALKKGREEMKKDKEESIANSNSLFGQKDQDMRSPKSHQNVFSPSNRGAWSSYRTRHSEIASRRASYGDVDMRDEDDDDACSEPNSPSFDREQTVRLFQEIMKVNPSQLTSTQRNELAQYVTELGNLSGIKPPPLPMSHPHIQRPMMRVPPIKTNNWNVGIQGLNYMPDIGIDPRLLNIAGPNKPTKTIAIDGCHYTLILDRLQPLIMINGQLHAVRFQTHSAYFRIHDTRVQIPSIGCRKVNLHDRTYVVCLGGPGHELIIDGVAYNVPLNNNIVYVTIGRKSFEIQFVGERPHNLDVLPPIPPQVLKWAAQHLFGSAKKLFFPPANPIHRLQSLQRGHDFKENSNMPVNEMPSLSEPILPAESVPDTDPSPTSVAPNSDSHPSVPSQPLNIYELFNKLVAAGIVKEESAASQAPPDMSKYNLEKFKLPFKPEEAHLYKGHQCMQCGMRFEDLNCDEYKSHLDYHYVKNATDEGDVRSRNYFQSVRHWLISDNSEEAAPHFDEMTSDSERQVTRCKAFDNPDDNVCAVCFEKFDTVWDDEEEDWMLLDAIFSNGKVYHPICLADADKQMAETPYPTPDVPSASQNEEESYTTSNNLQAIKEESMDQNDSQNPSDTSFNEIENENTPPTNLSVKPDTSPNLDSSPPENLEETAEDTAVIKEDPTNDDDETNSLCVPSLKDVESFPQDDNTQTQHLQLSPLSTTVTS